MVIIPDQLQGRPVNIRSRQLNLGHINLRRQVLEHQGIRQLLKGNNRLHNSPLPVRIGGSTLRASVTISKFQFNICGSH